MNTLDLFLLGYIGPETMLPLTSALAAIGGVIMMFWNNIRAFCSACLRRIRGQAADVSAEHTLQEGQSS